MIRKIIECEKCGLCINQKPLLEECIRDCQVFWVGLSAKKIKDEEDVPLAANTKSGLLIKSIEERCKNVITYKTNLVKCLPLNDNEKLSVLKTLKNILEDSGQSSIGINDITARWMYNKQHRPQLSYNLQHGVDTKSILICGINVSQSPTDHYEIPALMEKVLKNLNGIQPEL